MVTLDNKTSKDILGRARVMVRAIGGGGDGLSGRVQRAMALLGEVSEAVGRVRQGCLVAY